MRVGVLGSGMVAVALGSDERRVGLVVAPELSR
jgi:hypothetical protein